MRGLVLAIAMLAGCYKPEAGDCSYRCPEGACPVGLTCDGNGLCREPGKAGTPCAATDDAATCAMGEMSCGGTCTNVATDPLNCGTCGRACPCADGKCSVEMVHSGLYAPGVLAAGFGYVVFTEGKFTQSNALCSAPDAQIRLMESATKNEPYMIPIPTPGQCPGAIAVANDAFYVGRLGSVTRYTFGSTAEAGFVDTNSHYVGGIGVTPTWVFFGTHGSFQVFRSPRALSNMKTSIQMTTSRKVQDLVVTPSKIWFETSVDGNPTREIDVINHPDGTGDQLGVRLIEENAALAYGGDRVFIGELAGPAAGGTGALWSSAHDTIGWSSAVDSSEGIVDVVADDVAAYWAQIEGGETRIYMRAHSTMTNVLIAAEQPAIRMMAVDPPYLYWLTETDASDGALYRINVR